MARVLILREAEAARATAAALTEHGHLPLTIPVTATEALSPPAPDASVFSAVLVSSANAVPYAAAAIPRDRPMLAVGPATAEALRRAGFSAVESAASSGRDLARLAAERGAGGPFLYLAGRVRAEGLEAALSEAGLPVEILEVYDTRALHPTRGEIEAALGGRSPDAVLVLSIGQAEGLGRLVAAAPELFSPPLRILCLSDRIGDALPDHIDGTVFVSPDGELSNLLALV